MSSSENLHGYNLTKLRLHLAGGSGSDRWWTDNHEQRPQKGKGARTALKSWKPSCKTRTSLFVFGTNAIVAWLALGRQ